MLALGLSRLLLQLRAALPGGRSDLAVGRLPAERTWLRWGSRPYLAAVDSLALLEIARTTAGRRADLAVLSVAVGLSGMAYHDLYKPRLSRSVLDDAPALVVAGFATMVTPAVLTRRSVPRQFTILTALTLALPVLGRAITYSLIRRGRASGRVRYNTIIVGAGNVGMDLARVLREHCEYGVEPVGFVDVAARVQDPAQLPVPLIGRPQELAELIQDYNVRNVIVSFTSLREVELIEILRTCDRLETEIFIVPRLFEFQHISRDMDYVWGIPLVRARRAAFRAPTWRLKRVVDVAVAGGALLALSPIMGICALAVRLEGGPGVIFRQTRIGLDGRPFCVYKFRSLKPANEAESQTNWNVSKDDRLGRVGRILRKTSLDELPQLWNVLKGDMSLVGPRPERPHFVDQFATHVPRYTGRHRLPAGLTGWAQIHGLRGDTSIDERARFDNYYIENWSLWGDIKIALRTISYVFAHRGGGS